MTTITLQDAQADFSGILDKLRPGEEVVIVNRGETIARLQKSEQTSWPCKAGSAKDKILWIAPDFDAPLEDFKEYME